MRLAACDVGPYGARLKQLDKRVAPSSGGSAAEPPTVTDQRSSRQFREREVVALLAEGLTNRKLATRLLHLAETAAVHVSNILAKLSMTSRDRGRHVTGAQSLESTS